MWTSCDQCSSIWYVSLHIYSYISLRLCLYAEIYINILCYLFSILKYFMVKGTCDTTASIIIINFIVIKFEYCCCKRAFILRWLELQGLGVTASKAAVVVLLSERAWCFRTSSFSLGMSSSEAGAPRWRTAQHLLGDVSYSVNHIRVRHTVCPLLCAETKRFVR